MRRSLILLVAVAGLAAPLHAQLRNPTLRPELVAGSDTNDAYQYYNLGLAKLDRDPKAAADAFYWASRIGAGWADALYARRVALLISDPRRLQRYMRGDKGVVQSKEVRQIDSLYLRALMQNPFLVQKHDKVILDAWVRSISDDAARSGGGSTLEVENEIQEYIRHNAGPEMRAWLAFGWGNYTGALSQYAIAIKQAKRKSALRIDRGRIFFQLGQVDSASTELTLALEEMRKRDQKDVVFIYESKAFLEHSIGVIHERKNEIAEAREAYGRALTEDLSYYPAHLRLSFLALETKDTATALNELDLAVQIRGDEPMLRYLYGHALALANKLPEAERELKKAIELEPLFALPNYMLGKVYDQQMKATDALATYRNFLALASRSDGRRAEVEQAVATLQSAVPVGGVKP